MGAETAIEWAKHTWSPWGGCQRVSPACDNCYAEALDKRFGRAGAWGPQGIRNLRTAAYYRQADQWNAAAAAAGRQETVFPSMCDPFDNHRSILPAWRLAHWALIRRTPHLTWLLLTKRPQNIRNMLPLDWGAEGWPNVWLGCTAENQQEADRRIPHLQAVPARVRFLSCEPLLGQLDLAPYFLQGPRIHWVITGGESGPHARLSDPRWFSDIRTQCGLAGVAFFHKQNGEWCDYTETGARGWTFTHAAKGRRYGKLSGPGVDGEPVLDGKSFESRMPFSREHDPGPIMVRVGKVAAGATLNGRIYRDFPQPVESING
jgi:protein gp37